MADAKITRIYVLRDPSDGAVRYVGKTVKPLAARLAEHLQDARRRGSTPRSRWIRSLGRSGAKPIIELVEEAASDWAAREAHWIAYFRTSGAGLTNLTDGGDGLSGRRMPAAQRALLSAALKRDWAEARERRIEAARNQSAEARASRSEAARARFSLPEERARMSASCKARWAKPEEKAKAAASWTPERRAAAAIRIRARNYAGTAGVRAVKKSSEG